MKAHHFTDVVFSWEDSRVKTNQKKKQKQNIKKKKQEKLLFEVVLPSNKKNFKN
jgi:hypothetical protein